MLRIRLQRTGRRNSPAYRIVLAEHSAPIKGKNLEVVGHYLPSRDPAVLEYNEERISHWVSKGAKPTDTVARLLSKSGMKGLEKYILAYTKQKKRKETEEKEPSTEAPVETSTKEATDKEAPSEDEASNIEEAPTEDQKPETSDKPVPKKENVDEGEEKSDKEEADG